MKRIYVIVEGPTEREFVSRILMPYFGQHGLTISAIPMLKSGGGMGFSNLEHFKNNVKPLLYELDQPIITTMVDLFRFPVQSSSHIEESELRAHVSNPDIDARILGLENLLQKAVQYLKPYGGFIPYIQKHEFEALLFCDPSVFWFENEAIKLDIEKVLAEIKNPEDINTTVEGHPAARLKRIFSNHQKKYQKAADAVDFAELAGIQIILEKCPRFRVWVQYLIAVAKN